MPAHSYRSSARLSWTDGGSPQDAQAVPVPAACEGASVSPSSQVAVATCRVSDELQRKGVQGKDLAGRSALYTLREPIIRSAACRARGRSVPRCAATVLRVPAAKKRVMGSTGRGDVIESVCRRVQLDTRLGSGNRRRP